MAVAMTMYGKIGANLFGGETAGETTAIDYLSDAIKVALASTTYVPNPDTHEFFSDVTNELTTALGYTAGGAALGTKTSVYTAAGNITVHSAANTLWTAAGGSLVFRYAIVYDSTPATAATQPLIGYIDFATQTITDGNTVTIAWDGTNGIFKVTAV